MDFIGNVKEISQPRVLQGNQGETKIVDVVVDGGDVITASAFDKVADMFIGGNIKVGHLVKCRISASVRSKDDKKFQSLRIESIVVLSSNGAPF